MPKAKVETQSEGDTMAQTEKQKALEIALAEIGRASCRERV